ncbi:MJ0042-type zinc finger domain-containing protein [Bradyrhizobium lablabi]|uniref:MJ0042-type zinc finger domain-containing protein n=1 Tax=Bradyrhizobium lablabi TaxID=722472 RepID=UPI001BA54745|nr:MJ0042-type zinc finger domain-containing protein [Bradyrhizobium lablabi]MBR0691716.1 zinc-ribbon domain-containing protein [Bradyrhizobium lablabi]
MHIVCPHCTTSYAIKAATLGEAGRSVRCCRCKEVWLARPEDAIEAAAVPVLAAAGESADCDPAAEWETMARHEDAEQIPLVESPSISADLPSESGGSPAVTRQDAEVQSADRARSRFRLRKLFRLPSVPRIRFMPTVGALPTASATMGALIIALVVWRSDVVHLLPQTALFYRMAGLDVNLRGLAFRDVRITNETVDGKPVLVIEGVIVGQTRKAVELPRLRFSVRDAQGAEIYAWNAVLEQTVLNPGERAVFKSRLASPPPEGRNVDVRFFNKSDLAGGHA